MSNPVANLVRCPNNGTAAQPSISFGGNSVSNSGTGIYGSELSVSMSVGGSNLMSMTAGSLALASGVSLATDESNYSGASSYQPIGPDLNLSAGAGKNANVGTAYLAAVMGNVLGDSLTKTGNYIGGVIGALSVTGSNASTYPKGAVLAQITDGVSIADGAVVAYIDGDDSQTNANAAFKAMSNNSTAGSGFNYGLDLQGDAHDGFNALAILKADIRTASGAVIMTGGGAPTNNVTGLNFAGKGSLYIDTTNGKLYITTGASSSPTWVVVGSQS